MVNIRINNVNFKNPIYFEKEGILLTLNEFLNNIDDLYISCPTYEEAVALCMAFQKRGKKWRSGNSYVQQSSFDCYKENMVYSNKGSYADTSFARNHGYTIYKLNEINEYKFEILENINLIKKISHTLETYEEFNIPIENIVEDYARKGIDISMDLVITIKEKR